MAGWLTRAASAFGRHAAPPPQAFDFPCDCGERLSGWRTSSHQKLNCAHCDRPVLVLPADVYPAVKRTTPAMLPKKSPAVVHPEARPKKSSSKAVAKDGSSMKEAKGTAAKPAANAASTEDRISLSPLLEQSRSRRRSLRLVVVCILAMVVVTGWSLRSRARREQARTAIPVATEEGLAALHAGNFASAVEQLGIAVDAINTLGKRDATAATIRQAHREATAAHGLASADITEIAQQVLSRAGTVEDRQRHARTEFGAQWLIFDAGVVNRSRGDKLVAELDVPLSVGEHTLQVDCEFPALRRLLQSRQDQSPLRVIFAAQLDQWQLPHGPSGSVTARINPATAFFWTDYESYLAVGFWPAFDGDEQQTRSVLNHQRQLEPAL